MSRPASQRSERPLPPIDASKKPNSSSATRARDLQRLEHLLATTTTAGAGGSAGADPSVEGTVRLPAPPKNGGNSGGSSARRSYSAVTFVDGAGRVACPVCAARFRLTDHQAFRRHVFACRESAGIDPLMPLHMVRRIGGSRGEDELAAVVRPIGECVAHTNLFEGVPLSVRLPGIRKAVTAREDGKRWLRIAQSSSGQRIGGTAGDAPKPSPSPRRSTSVVVERGPSSSDRIEHHINDALRDVITQAAEPSEERGDVCLMLGRLSLPYRQAARVASVLCPTDGTHQLPARCVDLTRTRFLGEESAQVFFAAVMRNHHVERLLVDEDGDPQALAKLLAKTRFAPAQVAQWLEENRTRRETNDADEAFLGVVNDYHQHARSFHDGALAITRRVKTFIEELQNAEIRSRRAIYAALHALHEAEERKRRKAEQRRLRAEERLLLERRETAKRSLVDRATYGVHLSLLAEWELHVRDATIAALEQAARARLKFEEREGVFRCVVVARARDGRHAIYRLVLERTCESERAVIAGEFIASLQVLAYQERQHKALCQWRRRQREELESALRHEERLRDSILRDQEGHFQSSVEKLQKALEATMVRDDARRKYVEDHERLRRAEFESCVTSFADIAGMFFHARLRTLRQAHKNARHEARRLALVQQQPTLVLSDMAHPNVLACALATEGHDPAHPQPIFEGAAVRCTLDRSWLDELTAVEQLCRQAAADEKAAMVEHLQTLQRYFRIFREASDAALAPVDTSQPSSADIRAVVKPTPVLVARPNRGAGGDLSSQTSVRRSRSRFGGPLTAAELFSADEDLAAAQADILRERRAWFDRAAPAAIQRMKEGVLAVRLIVGFDQDDDDGLASGNFAHLAHALVLDVPHGIPLDTITVTADDEPCALAAARAGSPSDDASRRDSLVTPCSDMGSMDGYEASMSTPQPPPPPPPVVATNLIEVVIRAPAATPAEKGQSDDEDDDDTMPDPAAAPAAFVPMEAVAALLAGIKYRCTAAPSVIAEDLPATVRIRYRLEATVETAAAYIHADPSGPRPPPSHRPSVAMPSVADLYSPLVPPRQAAAATIAASGELLVAIVPSVFAVDTAVEDALTAKVVVEGQIDAVPVVRALAGVSDPWLVYSHDDGAFTIAHREDTAAAAAPGAKVVAGGIAGSTVTCEVIGEGASYADRLSLCDAPPAMLLEASHDRQRRIHTVTINARPFATVIDGVVQVTEALTPTTTMPTYGPRFVLQIDARYPSELAEQHLALLMRQLRFHNYQQDPAEGVRTVRVAVRTATGACSHFDTRFEVEGIDKPTELRLPHTKIVHRAPSAITPPALRHLLAEIPIPVFPQAVVYDDDTDRFGGGFMRVTLCDADAGDALLLCPNTHLWSFFDEALQIPSGLSMDGSDICFEERVVGTLVVGEVLTERAVPAAAVGSNAIEIQFAKAEDQCSIAAVQAMVRAVVLATQNPAQQTKTHPIAASRDVKIHIQIMENEQQCEIDHQVSIRGGAHTIQLLEKGASIEFREGSQPVKLGYFDLNNDRINPITNFGGGFILATIADGYDTDLVALQPSEGDYKLMDPRKAMQQSKGTMQSLLRSATLTMRTLKGSATLTSSTSGERLPTAVGYELNLGAAQAIDPTMKPQAVVFAGMQQPMATYVPFRGGVLIQFAPDTKRDAVQRKHVLALLRNITYFHPCRRLECTQKLARVLVSDSIANTPTQAVVQIRVDAVDDVTEIRCRSPKRRILQSRTADYPLLPYGRSLIYDSDTEFFDGGCMTFQCLAGSSRGDVISLVPPCQQHPQDLQRAMAAVPDLTAAPVDDLVYDPTCLAFMRGDGTVVGTVESSQRDGGVAELKISFPLNETLAITADVVSHMMSSVLFGNQAERLRDHARTILVRIRDRENPVEGKLRLTLDVQPPLAAFPTIPGVFESLMLHRMYMAPDVGSGVNPGQRLALNLDRFGDLKASCGAPGVTVTLSGPEAQLARTRLFVPVGGDCGLALKDGTLYAGTAPAAHLATTDHSATLTFVQGCKAAALPKDRLQALLRAVVVSVVEELDVRPPPALAVFAAPVFGEVVTPVSYTRNEGNEASVTCTDAPPPPDGPTRTRSMSGPSRAFQSIKGRRQSLFNAPSVEAQPSADEDDEEYSLVVTWRIHDGNNESVLETRLIPRNAPPPAQGGAASRRASMLQS